jgi:hypothetical protein
LICVRRVIKGKSTTLVSHWADLFKNFAKYAGEKSIEIRVQVAKCYKEAARSLKGTIATQFYDTLYGVSVKGFEDEQRIVREQYVAALSEAMTQRLQECVHEKQFNATTKRKPSEPPKSLMDVYNALQTAFMRDNEGVSECAALCIWNVLRSNDEYVRQTKPVLILQLELTWLSRASAVTFENFKTRARLEWLFVEYARLLDARLKAKLFDTILSNLEKVLEKKQKNEQPANDAQIVLIISALNALIVQLGWQIIEHNPAVNSVTDILVPFLSWERPAVRLHAAECIKSLAYRCKPWLCQLLSLFLNMTTVTHAELAALPPVPLFVDSGSPAATKELKASVNAQYTLLGIQSTCLSSLLYCTDLQLSGVPLDIANAALSAARGIILGYYHNEDEDGSAGQAKDSRSGQHKENELVAKRHAGWIIIQGLLGLGSTWVAGITSTLLKLWNGTFDKDSCVTHPYLQEGQGNKLDPLAQDFVVKSEALAALHDFVVNYKELIAGPVVKFVATFLSNCAHYLFHNATKDPKKALFELFPAKYLQMKAVCWLHD